MNLTLSLNDIDHKINPINMRDIFNRKSLQHVTHHIGMIGNRYMSRSIKSNYNTNTNIQSHTHDRVLKFDKTFEKYLDEIEDITHRKLHPSQRIKLKYAIEHHDYKRLSSDESHKHRRKFSSERSRIIEDWEKMTGNKWPVYDKPVYSKKGKIIRQVGDRFDAHEIILNSWGSPHETWNITPAAHPDEHQQQIHRKNGMADKIFG